MDITSTSTVAAASPAATRPEGQGTLIKSDFNTFLRMLTTQLQNQDPLNPIESSDYAQQLATFSGVEQQVRTNQLLQSLTDNLGLSGLGELSGWIGKEALSDAPVPWSGAPVSLSFSRMPGATEAQLVILDAQGKEVGRAVLPPGQSSAVWSGQGANGAVLPPGRYSFKVESFAQGTSLGTSGAGTYARVDEVRSTPAGPVLLLAGGAEVTAKQILALRSPP